MDHNTGTHYPVDESRHRCGSGSSDETEEPLLPQDQKPTGNGLGVNWHRPGTQRTVFVLVSILLLLFETGNAIRTAPLIAVYEAKLCSDLGVQIDLDAQRPCSKLPGVQRSLALILGVSQFIDCVPMLLLSALYGSLADRYGRKPILLLAYLGLILSSAWTTAIAAVAPSLPLRLVWLGPIFTVVGGGATVPISILMASTADVVSPGQKVTVFAWIHAAALVAVMLGSLTSSMMMPRSGNFPPLLVGLLLMCSCLVLSLWLPDTRPPTRSQNEISARDPAPALTMNSRASQDSGITIRPTKPDTASTSIYRSFQDLWQVQGALPILLAGFVSMLGQQVQILILEYMPSRFDVTIAEANLFNILGSGINIVVLFALLPQVSTLLLKQYNTSLRKDVALARVSSSIFIVGALVLGMAGTLTMATLGLSIFSLGIGLSSLLRSIFVELFPVEDAAFAITLISTVKGIGGSLSGPMYSGAFAASLNGGDHLRGLPFFVSVLCFVVVQCALFWNRVRRTR